MKNFLISAVLLLACGCANPHTKVTVGAFGSGFSLYDNKDNDLLIEGLEVDPESKALKCAKFTLRNNASDPRIANVEQIRAGYEGAALLFPAMLDTVMSRLPQLRQFAPVGTVNGPLGGSISIPADVLKEAVQQGIDAYIKSKGGVLPAPTPGN